MSAARVLEATCWLTAAILAVALALGSQNAVASAPAIRVAAAAPTPQLRVSEQRCIERILSRSADRSEEEVAARIKRDCFASRRATPSASFGPQPCDRLFSVRLTPANSRVAGCLGG
jgi:hypothetical protein